MDPRLARMDQDLRGPPPAQPAPVNAPPAIAPVVPAGGTFNMPDTLVSSNNRDFFVNWSSAI